MGCRVVEGNPLYYLLLLEASSKGAVEEVRGTCMVEAGCQHFICMPLPGGSDVPIRGGTVVGRVGRVESGSSSTPTLLFSIGVISSQGFAV